MLRKWNISDLIISALAIILTCFSIFTYFLDTSSQFISLTGVLLCLVLMSKFVKTIPLFILFSYALLYNIDAAKYYFSDIYLTVWPDFQTKEMVNKVLVFHNVFLATLGIMIPANVCNISFNIKCFTIKSHYLFLFNVCICILILFFGISGENIFEGGQYGSSEKSVMHEYFILFYFMLLLTIPTNTLLYNGILYLLLAIYSLKTIFYGGRIEVLQITLLFFYVGWVFPHKIRKRWVYLLLILAFYLSGVVGNIRANPLDFLAGNYLEFLNPVDIFKSDPDAVYLYSNQGDVIQSSARILGMIKVGILGISERLIGFCTYILSVIIPTRLSPSYSNLASFRQDLYRSGGGGLISTYFFAWLGFIGPLLAGLFIGYFIKKSYYSNSVFLKIYGICILVTFPRWFSYNPVFLVKFCIYSVFIYFIFMIIYNSFLKRNVVR